MDFWILICLLLWILRFAMALGVPFMDSAISGLAGICLGIANCACPAL